MKLAHRIAGALTLGAALLAGTVQAQDIVIGYNADQSGTGVAELGIAGRWGFEAAIEDINRAGGLLGRKVVGVIRDDLGTPPKSIQNMTEPGCIFRSNARSRSWCPLRRRPTLPPAMSRSHRTTCSVFRWLIVSKWPCSGPMP